AATQGRTGPAFMGTGDDDHRAVARRGMCGPDMPDMKASAVLAAAAALHEFTLGQVAAYCDADRCEVEGVIDSFSRFFAVVGRAADGRQGDARQGDARQGDARQGDAQLQERRWRVVDAAGLRAAIAQDSPAQDSPPTSRTTALSSRRAVAARSL